jgi:pimeloyl-ACP methyl ester carboxylesterase
MQRRSFLSWPAAVLLPACATTQHTDGPSVVEDFTIDAADPGVQLFLHSKRPRDAIARPERTVLFVHGLTYPGHVSFDLPLGGQSWMDHLAQRGFDTWTVDVRGYGKSTRPAAMAQPPEANAPLVDAAAGASDVAAAARFIRERRRIDRLVIVGWSWGTVLSARVASDQPAAVERLVLYAPVWRWREGPVPKAPPGAYRRVTREAARRGGLNGVPVDAQAQLIPQGWFDQWADANWATDPDGARSEPPTLRAPNGPLSEVLAHWVADKPLFDPARITAPTLLVVGQWDSTTPAYMARELVGQLTHARTKDLVVVPEATHQLFLERQRGALFSAVDRFLDG